MIIVFLLLKPKQEDQPKTGAGILSKTLNRMVALPIVKSQPARGCFHPGASILSSETVKVEAKQPVTGTQMVAAMLQYIWPKEDKAVRDRVKLAVGLLIGAKVLNVAVPFLFKYAVDYLNVAGQLNVDTAASTVTTVATCVLLGCR